MLNRNSSILIAYFPRPQILCSILSLYLFLLMENRVRTATGTISTSSSTIEPISRIPYTSMYIRMKK